MSLTCLTTSKSLLFSSCNNGRSSIVPVNEQSYNVKYKIDNQINNIVFSPFFTTIITNYIENGDSAVLQNVILPWEQTITIKAPFNTKMYREYIFAEKAFSITARCGNNATILWKSFPANVWISSASSYSFTLTKVIFLEWMATGLNKLKFDYIKTLYCLLPSYY